MTQNPNSIHSQADVTFCGVLASAAWRKGRRPACFLVRLGLGLRRGWLHSREANLGLTPGLSQCQFHVSVSWETDGRGAGTAPGKINNSSTCLQICITASKILLVEPWWGPPDIQSFAHGFYSLIKVSEMAQ